MLYSASTNGCYFPNCCFSAGSASRGKARGPSLYHAANILAKSHDVCCVTIACPYLPGPFFISLLQVYIYRSNRSNKSCSTHLLPDRGKKFAPGHGMEVVAHYEKARVSRTKLGQGLEGDMDCADQETWQEVHDRSLRMSNIHDEKRISAPYEVPLLSSVSCHVTIS